MNTRQEDSMTTGITIGDTGAEEGSFVLLAGNQITATEGGILSITSDSPLRVEMRGCIIKELSDDENAEALAILGSGTPIPDIIPE